MIVEDKNTEQKIVDAASEIFHSKGFDGARMQEIAHHAGINKGLLHYYFKTKEILFEAIFSKALKQIGSHIAITMQQDLLLPEKIDRIVDGYMDMLLKNPSLPRFVLNELDKNPEKFITTYINQNINHTFSIFEKDVNQQISQGRVLPVDANQLFMDLISLVIFPFVGKVMLQTAFNADNNLYRKMLEARRSHVKEFLKSSIKI